MYLLIIGLAFVFIYPFLYMIVNSVMSNADLNSRSVNWLPTEFKFENYSLALDLLNGKKFAINSAKVTIIATIGHVIACSFIGYGFARYNFPGKKILFALVILAFIVPTQTLIIPSYLTYSNISFKGQNCLDTYIPLLVPTFFGFGLRGALYIFLFRQFYLTVPKSLEEAARIDGCGFMKTYWKIVFPLAKATLVVAVVLSIVWHWNDSYEPSIYINSTAKSFLPPRLKEIIAVANALPDAQEERMRQLGLEGGEDTLNDAVVMAGATVISAPILLFFAFAQSQFMQGIERSGITGE
jgi:multiple sugar transport system permease protein